MQPVAPPGDASVSGFIGTAGSMGASVAGLGRCLEGTAIGLNKLISEGQIAPDTRVVVRVSKTERITLSFPAGVIVSAP